MRRLPYIIAAILVFLIAGYSVFWYSQAQRAKTLFIDIAAHLPEHTQVNGKQFTLKYDDIRVGGYPLSYRVIIKNPVLAWKQMLPDNMVAFKDKKKSDVAPMDTLKLTGELTLESNSFASAFSASTTGVADGTMETPEGPMSWQSHWDGANTFSIAFNEEGRKRMMAGENPFAMLQDPQAMVKSLHSLSFHGTNISVNRIPDGKQIFFVPSNDVDFSINPVDQANSEIKLKIDTKDMVLTHEYGMLLAGFYMINGDKASAPTYRQFDERAGKTTIKVDVSATGPFQPQTALPPEYNLNIESKEFSIRNNWYEITLPMVLKIKKSANANSFSLTHEGVIHFSKEMEDALRQDYITSGRAYAELKQMFEQRGAEAPPAYKLDPSGIFPAISSFGTIKTAADMSTDDAGKALTIKRAAIQSDPYSLDASGNVRFTDNTAAIKVECTHCLQMTDDAMSYYNRVLEFMRQINPQSKLPALSASQIESVKQMLTSLDADPATPDVITFNYQQKDGMSTISGQPLQQVMLQAMVIISAPAAGSPDAQGLPPLPDADGATVAPLKPNPKAADPSLKPATLPAAK